MFYIYLQCNHLSGCVCPLCSEGKCIIILYVCFLCTVRRKKSVESSRERGTKKISKPVDKKKRGRSPRSSSTSSRTSSTTSSSASRGQKRVRKFSPSPARHPAHKQRSPVVSTIRKDVKGNKRNKRGAHSGLCNQILNIALFSFNISFFVVVFYRRERKNVKNCAESYINIWI